MLSRSIKRWLSLLTASCLLFGSWIPQIVAEGEQLPAPELIVTEIHPDVSGADEYEFFEVYNNSNRVIVLNDYTFLYRYTSGSGADLTLTFPQAVVEPQRTIVFWYNNAGRTAAQFNAKYGVNISGGGIVEVGGFSGMANSGNRAIVIRNPQGVEIASASYLQTDVGAGLGVHYKWSGTGIEEEKFAVKAAPTPGAADPAQLPGTPVDLPEEPDNRPPHIEHSPVTEADYSSDITVAANITNYEDTVTDAVYNDPVTASLFYKTASAADFASVPMAPAGDSLYLGTIPKSALVENQLLYFIQARDSRNTVTTDTYGVEVKFPDIDFDQMPPFLITELVPDSTNVNGADGYEFVEIYNNTDRAINFKDYKLQYRYTDSGPEADVIWPAEVEDIVIPSRETLVFWVINGRNDSLTVSDFNANYKANLKENEDIVRVHAGGMANGGKRGLIVSTNTNNDLIVASYDNDAETVANKGIFYKYPLNGSRDMVKYSAGTEPATPGTISAGQVPPMPVKLPEDTQQPVVADLTELTEVDQSKDFELIADAKDENGVKSVAVFYKTNLQTEYIKRYLEESFADTFYHHKIYSPELIGKSYIDYYYVVSDGTHEVASDTYRIRIAGGPDRSALRLNVKEGEFVAGSYILKATSEQLPPEQLSLLIDDSEAGQDTYPALENDAYFAFDATGVNYYFKNGVTVGEEILRIFDDTINSWETLTVPVAADRFQLGDNIVSIRAGSKASPFDTRPEENKDDFDVRNVRLVLADGAEVYDPLYADREAVIKMGDSAGKHPVIDFRFSLGSEHLRSKAYRWDTTQAADGVHRIKVTDGSNLEVTKQVIVDNTAPEIDATVAEGREYKGTFTINAAVTDALAGVDQVEASLDGRTISLPYEASSASLPSGNHVLQIEAKDKVGNVSRKTVAFTTPEEHPDKPELVTPKQGAKGVTAGAELTVTVSDPTNDEMNVSFYRGFKYNAATLDAFAGFENAVDREPPLTMIPEGETAFDEEAYRKIGAADGGYLVTDAVSEFPYQRYQVKLDSSVKPSDPVEIVWKGNSLEGRKVTMYAWKPAAGEWVSLTTHVAGAEDFELKANVTAGEYTVDGGSMHVLVQDEIPPTPDDYDYSFVWMSDTQYYSESYPHIYKSIVDWIAAKKDEMKIKYVVHTGDLVDEADKPYQWEVASENMKVLEDANIPYGVLAGNHDVYGKLGAYDQYWKHFGEDRFKKQPTYGGSLDNNRGHYDLISSNGNDYIFVYMGWGIGDEEIEWINEVVRQHPDRMAVLNFHEYLLVSGNRSPIAEKIFQKVVVPNKNVIAALSGHYHDAELLVDEIDDNGDGQPDRSVYQMLADYQGGPEGGQGYIRLMQFDIDNNKLHIKTYSPYLNDYNFYNTDEYPGKDEFSLDLDLQPKTKRVATDYVEVNVYSDQLIGTAAGVAGGETASASWLNLARDTVYQWYAVAYDSFGGRTLSDIWSFATGSASSSIRFEVRPTV
ncbi:lamin tail domain-containing protein [Paenibacillus alkalitolerans]|uniref:lamin tail domain-containing protein n=1 Tax=Paenibacillus alkalitolerans TaxID=2799335 RepID=UPI0018F4B30A|nr:lamin tail domain-containing protein [Paenibacillus alkalitolerans]